MEIVAAEHLSKRFGFTWALRDISLKLGYGVHLLLGPNGSGKTTFLKLAAGMLKPTAGSIRILGLNPWFEWRKLHSRVTVAMEGAPLPWWMSGRDLIECFVSMKGSSIERAEELAKLFSIDGFWRRPIFTYSSGMAKRVLLLLAFLCDAQLYILDEPFTLLDKSTVERLTGLIATLKDEGASFLVASHFVPESFDKLVDTVVSFEEGRVTGLEIRHYYAPA